MTREYIDNIGVSSDADGYVELILGLHSFRLRPERARILANVLRRYADMQEGSRWAPTTS